MSLFNPARGCNCEGSAKEELPRKASTPWAEVGSKGVGVKVVVGVVGAAGAAGAVEVEVGVCDEDLRPVSASQMDILAGAEGRVSRGNDAARTGGDEWVPCDGACFGFFASVVR